MSQEPEKLSRSRKNPRKPEKKEKVISKENQPIKYYASKVWRPFRRFWKKYSLTKISLIAILVIIVAIGSYLFYLAKTANVSVLQSSISAQTQIIDKNGDVAGELYGSKGTAVQFNEISDNIKNAVVATEDRTFYKNHGVNLSRFILATVTLGHFGGGSTITQQLAKNAYLSQAQTIDRKAREFFLALEINKHYSKQEILTMYLNNSYFGNGVWGIQDASEKYFGVPATQVTVDEAATLAGMLKGPEIYNPLYDNAKYAVPRRNTVLQNMVNAGYLKQDQANQFAQVNVLDELHDNYVPQSQAYKYPSYFNAVITEAENKFGLSLRDIMNNGYKIYTSMDPNMQNGMQQTYSNVSLFPQAADGTYAQSGSVAIDPKTGGVEALVGNVNTGNYNAFLNFNYATQSKRSTGSTIKPLIAYLPAIQAGWSIDKTLEDTKTTFPGNWTPNDDDGQFRGALPMYDALANSYNIPAIKTYQTITPEKGNAIGREFGLNLTNKNDILPTVLGSGVETNPWQMAQAYATFANGGVMNTAHVITKIENAAGQTIGKAKVEQKRIMSQSDADKMNQMMLGTFTNGSAWNAAPSSYTMAGKTGTNNTTDQWVIGYTPDIAMALWVGFPQETNAQYQLQGTSEGQTSVIFRDEASYILPFTKGTEFNVQNAYAAKGIAPITPAWTALRDQQDAIVQQEQYQNNTTGNTPAPAQSSSSSGSSNSGNSWIDKAGKSVGDAANSIGDAAKSAWDKAKNLFGQ